MRGLPVLGMLALALTVCAGCSSVTRTALPDAGGSPRMLSSRTGEPDVPSRHPGRPVSRISVPRGAGDAWDPPDREASPTGRSAEIARRTEEAREVWRRRCEELSIISKALPATVSTSAEEPRKVERIVQPDPEALIAIERKYAPRFLNCRLRIMALRSRLAAADAYQQPELQKRMDEAQAELAAVNDECRREIQAAIEASSAVAP